MKKIVCGFVFGLMLMVIGSAGSGGWNSCTAESKPEAGKYCSDSGPGRRNTATAES